MSSCAVMDIEDFSFGGEMRLKRRNVDNSSQVVNPENVRENGDNEIKLRDLENSNIPGVGSIFLKTWGCSHNHSDTEYMAGQLASNGYSITGNSIAYFLL